MFLDLSKGSSTRTERNARFGACAGVPMLRRTPGWQGFGLVMIGRGAVQFVAGAVLDVSSGERFFFSVFQYSFVERYVSGFCS